MFCKIRWIQSFVPLKNLVNESWFDSGHVYYCALCSVYRALCAIVKLLDKMLHESMSNWKHRNQSKGFATSNILTSYILNTDTDAHIV